MKFRYLLYRSFDKRLSKKEETILDQGLSASEELKKEQEDITVLRKVISQSAEQSFGEGFVNGVMSEITLLDKEPRWKHIHIRNPKPSFSTINLNYVFAMAMALLITVMSPTIYSWLTTTQHTTQRGHTLTVTLPDNSIVQLNAESQISYSTSFNEDSRLITMNGEAYFNVEK